MMRGAGLSSQPARVRKTPTRSAAVMVPRDRIHTINSCRSMCMGKGSLTLRTLEEAVAAIREVNGSYSRTRALRVSWQRSISARNALLQVCWPKQGSCNLSLFSPLASTFPNTICNDSDAQRSLAIRESKKLYHFAIHNGARHTAWSLPE
jgi:hypothetical protein